MRSNCRNVPVNCCNTPALMFVTASFSRYVCFLVNASATNSTPISVKYMGMANTTGLRFISV